MRRSSSALLEALDPEQNKNLTIIILVDYDLSDVCLLLLLTHLFFTIIRQNGCKNIWIQEDEKVNISQKYLIPKQSNNNGLEKDEWNIDENE